MCCDTAANVQDDANFLDNISEKEPLDQQQKQVQLLKQSNMATENNDTQSLGKQKPDKKEL